MNTNDDWDFMHDNLDHFQPEVRVEPVFPEENKQFFLRNQERWSKGSKLNISDYVQHKYRYKPLQDDQIRLLYIRPGKRDEPIRCKMEIRSIEAVKKKYEALSYHWGTNDGTKANNLIFIMDAAPKDFASVVMKSRGRTFSKAKQFGVHDNLYSALQYCARRISQYCFGLMQCVLTREMMTRIAPRKEKSK